LRCMKRTQLHAIEPDIDQVNVGTLTVCTTNCDTASNVDQQPGNGDEFRFRISFPHNRKRKPSSLWIGQDGSSEGCFV
jgi:hypothetical protein